MNICEKCGEETDNPRFCSLRCANSHPRAEKYLVDRTRFCDECGGQFSYKQPEQRFCSRSCSATNSNKVSPKRTAAVLNCLFCDIALTEHQFKFCSMEHQQLFYRATRIQKWLETGHGIIGSDKNHYIRSYLYQQQNDLCAICLNSDEWQGKSLVFVLDHIDGNSENNSRENLRLICPNCDSQLPTYKARNRGNGRFSRRQRYKEGVSY